MKKILYVLMICLSLVITKPLLAGTCEGGEEFQGVVNGHTYCRSNSTMTWWAAFGWCKKQGRKLASINQLCPDYSGDYDNACPNVNIGVDSWAWSSNPTTSTGAKGVKLNVGTVNNINRNYIYSYAICY